jgi:hypothetical protein
MLVVNTEMVRTRCADAKPEQAAQYASCKMTQEMPRTATFYPRESDQTFFFRRLNETHYPYELARRQTDMGEDILRRYIEPLAKKLVKLQPAEEKFMAYNASEIFLNSLTYRPRENRYMIGLGTHVQVNWSHLLDRDSHRPWIFAGLGVMARNLDTYLGAKPDTLNLAPFISLSTNWTDKVNFWLEPEVGVSVGYNYASRGSSEICEAHNSWEPDSLCQAFFIQPHLSASLLSRIRVELGTMHYLRKGGPFDFTGLMQVQF